MLQGIDPPETKIEGPQGPKTGIELFEGEGAVEAAVAKYTNVTISGNDDSATCP